MDAVRPALLNGPFVWVVLIVLVIALVGIAIAVTASRTQPALGGRCQSKAAVSTSSKGRTSLIATDRPRQVITTQLPRAVASSHARLRVATWSTR